MTPRALVLGAGGQLGDAMAAALAATGDVVARTRRELDITDSSAVAAAIEAIRPAVIINCAAYTNVDGAEADPSTALAVNAIALRALARAAAAHDSTLVHYSTDFVFDGKTSTPYRETDAPNPRGVYAASKLLGEWIAAEAPRHYVLRVESLFGGARSKSSVDRLLDGILAGTEVRAFADRVVSPSYVEDVVRATLALVQRRMPVGLYHVVNSGHATWSDVARSLADVAGRPDARIVDVSVKDVSLLAPRPQFAALANDKLVGAGVAMPPWQDAIRRYVSARLARAGS